MTKEPLTPRRRQRLRAVSVSTLLKGLAPYLREQWARLAMIYSAMAMLALSSASLAFLTGPAVALVFGVGTQATAALRMSWFHAWLDGAWVQTSVAWLVAALLLANAMVKGVAQATQFTLLGYVSLHVQRRLRAEVFAHLLAQPPRFFQSRKQGDLLSRLTNDLTLIEQAVFYGLGSLLRDSLAVVVLVMVLVVHDPTLSLALLITVPLAIWPLSCFGRWLKEASRHSQSAQGAISSICHETLLGLTDLQLHQRELHQEEVLDKAAEQHAQAMRRSYLVRAVRTPTMEILGAAVLAVGIVALTRQSAGSTATTGAAHYVTFLAGMVLIYDPLKKLGQVGDFVHAGAAALERLGDLLKPSEKQARAKEYLVRPVTNSAVLCFDDVAFSYENKTIIDRVSFEVRHGQRVALVGPSGAGKSTLLALLCRLWTPQSGTIGLRGRDIQSLSVFDVRRELSVVSQEASLFAGTVAQNIALGRPDASRESIEAAAKAAGATDFIAGLQQGLDTPLGERGARLSGGQKQRLAIARALLRDTDILLLDEATSQLDHASQEQIQNALRYLMKHRTTLMVAHRLATVRDADHIIVLQAGQVKAQGPHEYLLHHNAFYAEWVDKEARPQDRVNMAQQGFD